jgi:hypothetical protein
MFQKIQVVKYSNEPTSNKKRPSDDGLQKIWCWNISRPPAPVVLKQAGSVRENYDDVITDTLYDAITARTPKTSVI